MILVIACPSRLTSGVRASGGLMFVLMRATTVARADGR
jgi:hypothetical protein